MSRSKRCCCTNGCPPGFDKAAAGLPDALQIDFSGASGTADGMPSDTAIGTCGANTIHTTWTQSDAIIDLLSSLIFDFVSGPTTGCCFNYKSRGTLTPCSEAAGDWIRLGGSPFAVIACAESFGFVVYAPDQTAGGGNACCPDEQPCIDVAPEIYAWNDGSVKIPRDLFASATLAICIIDNIASVRITVDLVATYDDVSSAGNCRYYGSQNGPRVPPDCDGSTPASTSCADEGTATTTCASTSGAIVITASADLSGVSGANDWEKIKNATWTGTFSLSICGPGGCCANSYTMDTMGCTRADTCEVVELSVFDEVIESDHGFDQQCFYSTGTISLAFSDAV